MVRLMAGRRDGQDLLLLEERTPSLSVDSLEPFGLTRREVEILLRVAQGKTNAEVATDLYVSPLTVKKNLERIYRKPGVESRTRPWLGCWSSSRLHNGSHSARAAGCRGSQAAYDGCVRPCSMNKRNSFHGLVSMWRLWSWGDL